jgi:hypothetical protein
MIFTRYRDIEENHAESDTHMITIKEMSMLYIIHGEDVM